MAIIVLDNFEGRTTINPASDGGTWIVKSGSWAAGSTSGGAHTVAGTGDGEIVRDTGQENMDATWTIQLPGPLVLESRLLFAYWEPSGIPTCIGIAYSGTAAGAFRIGDIDFGGYTTYPGATGLGTPWVGNITTVRATFTKIDRVFTFYQDGAILWTGTLGFPNVGRPPEDREYGTFVGMQTVLTDYTSSGEEFLFLEVVSALLPTQASTPRTGTSYFSSPANRRNLG